MIISASRRTDIPSYYSEWFLKRVNEGFVYVRNPMNYNQISKISLSRADVECIVFWTKNPHPMMKHLEVLDSYNYYFQFTLTSYDSSIERNLPLKKNLVPVFKALAEKIGKERVIWRYDPVLLSEEVDIYKHLNHFELLAGKLKDSTTKCVFSFLDVYPKIQKRIKAAGLNAPSTEQAHILAKGFSEICRSHGLDIATCTETLDLSALGIKTNKCIDGELIRNVFGLSGNVLKDPNQRMECGCVKSIDIGSYNTCKHGCVYCYANRSSTVRGQFNMDSRILGGEIKDSMQIYDRKMERLFSDQIMLQGL